MKHKPWFIGLSVGLLVALLVLTPALIISPPYGENGWYHTKLLNEDVFIVIDDLELRFYDYSIMGSPNQRLELEQRYGLFVTSMPINDTMQRIEIEFTSSALQAIGYNDAGDIQAQIEYQKIRNPFVIYYYWIKWRLD